MNRFSIVLLSALCATALSGCGGEDLSGPPTLRLGSDECAECGMIISEERCAGALLVERDGTREHLCFDDIGCMLDHSNSHRGEYRVLSTFVRDYSTREWCDALAASFVASNSIQPPTPMSSGLIAFRSVGAADEARQKFNGRTLAFDALADARRAWLVARTHPDPASK